MGPPHEGSIRRPIAPWANALPLSYVPLAPPGWRKALFHISTGVHHALWCHLSVFCADCWKYDTHASRDICLTGKACRCLAEFICFIKKRYTSPTTENGLTPNLTIFRINFVCFYVPIFKMATDLIVSIIMPCFTTCKYHICLWKWKYH